MKTICDYLVFDHKRCDDLFDAAENCIINKNWKDATARFAHFRSAMARHIEMEETVLLPAFETAMPGSAAPIAMLRREHRHIQGLVDRMYDALSREAPLAFIQHAESFTLLSQQHTMKEEDMLYPLLDRILAENTQRIIAAMRAAIDDTTSPE